MGNDLLNVTDDDLRLMIREIDRRREKLKTPRGRTEAEDNFIRIFKYLRVYGYKYDAADPEEDRLRARIWTNVMADEIAVYGFSGIWAAVNSFMSEDTREYRPIPMASDIIASCKKLGKNPKAELGRREAARREAELEAKWEKEREEYKKSRGTDEAVGHEKWLEDLRKRFPARK